MNTLDIKEISIEDVKPYPGNPRKNDKAVVPVANSIREFGFQQPIVVDKDMVVIVGHTRLLAAKYLSLKKVPVLIAKNLSPEQVKAYRLADNRTNENAEWEMTLLHDEMCDLMEHSPELIPITGFDKEEIKRAIDWGKNNGSRNFDAEDRPDPLTAYGDIWTSVNGEHTILCMENNCDAFKEYIRDKNIDCIITDPPYNISYESGKGKVNNDTFASQEAFSAFLGECFEPAIQRLRAGGALFTCGNQDCYYPTKLALDPQGLELRFELIWVKSRYTYSAGRMTFEKQHENIWVGWKKGAAQYNNPAEEGRALVLDDREDLDKLTKEELKQRLIDIHEQCSTVREAKHEKDKWANHPTVKPTALFVPLIRKSTLPGDMVLDIFAGAGVTSLAAEQLARKSISVELDPNYVDCILTRHWEHNGLDFVNQNGVHWAEIWEAEKIKREQEDDDRD